MSGACIANIRASPTFSSMIMSTGPCRFWRVWPRSGGPDIGPLATVWNSVGQGLSTMLPRSCDDMAVWLSKAVRPCLCARAQRLEQRLELVLAPVFFDKLVDPFDPVVEPAR